MSIGFRYAHSDIHSVDPRPRAIMRERIGKASLIISLANGRGSRSLIFFAILQHIAVSNVFLK